MDMNIRYGNMNPLSELPESIATGLGLGMQARRMKKEEQTEDALASNIPIQEPGERPQVQLEQVLQAEMSDLNNYAKYYEKTKKLEPEQKKWIFDDLRKSGIIKTELGQAITGMVGSDEIDPKEIASVLKSIKAKSPTADADLKILIAKAGGENSALGQSVVKKSQEMAAIQQQLDQQYSIKLRSAITQIEDAKENPQKYARKGQAAESVLKGLQNEGNYLSTLAQLSSEDSKWVEDYLRRQQEKRGNVSGRVSSSMVQWILVDKNNKPVYGKDGNAIMKSGTTVPSYPSGHTNVRWAKVPTSVATEQLKNIQAKTEGFFAEKITGEEEEIDITPPSKTKKASIDLQKKIYQQELKKFGEKEKKKAANSAMDILRKQGYTEFE